MNNDGQLIVQEQTIVPDLLCFYSRDWMKKEILLRGKLINFHKQGGGGALLQVTLHLLGSMSDLQRYHLKFVVYLILGFFTRGTSASLASETI